MVEATCPIKGGAMAFDPSDYDDVYETTSASEKTTLLRQGWALLDERFASVGGLADEPLATTVVRTAFSYKGGQGFWSGAAQQQPEPDPPHTETTYVLGWPKGSRLSATTDPYFWRTNRGGRTMFEAHRWLRDTEGAWDSLPEEGGVIDVELILGEADTPKRSECLGSS